MTIFSERLLEIFRNVPHKTALTLLKSGEDDHPISYARLVEGAAAYRELYHQAGVETGDVVIIILKHGSDLVYAFWGAVLHGAVPSILPFLSEKLSPDIYRQSLTALMDITAPKAFLTYPEFVPEVEKARAQAQSNPMVLVGEELTLQENPRLNAPGGLACGEDDIVLLQHSSGTTGLKKGVALSHGAVFRQLDSYARALELKEDDVVVSWLPLYHDMGLIAGFLMPILLGKHLVLMSPFDWVKAPYRLFQAVTEYRGTLMWLPNFAYNFCAQKIRARDLEGVDLSSLRVVTNCSETIHWKSHELFLDRYREYGLNPAALGASYAMAENVFAVTQGGGGVRPMSTDEISTRAFQEDRLARPSRGEDTIKWVSSGTLLDNVEVRVLGEKDQPLPERHVGEIVLRSDCMLTEYYNRPGETQKAFLDGWYRTGDLGYTANGEVFVTGRIKELIIVGGKNVFPQDLERLVNEIPGVYPGRVVAFGLYNDRIGTEEIVIIAETEIEDPGERRELETRIRLKINQGTDVVARYVHAVEPKWLIKTSSGKIGRGANEEKYRREFLV